MRDLTSQKPPEFDTPPTFQYKAERKSDEVLLKRLPETPDEHAQMYEDHHVGMPISVKVGEPHEIGDGIITGGWHTDTDHGVWVMYPDGSQLMIKTS